MNDRDERRQAGVPPGLCASCCHARAITSDRGTRFIMCELSKTDPRFRRYPSLPVVACDGYEREVAAPPHG
jgi:hypothetical protein